MADRIQFHHSERGLGDEEWFFLSRDEKGEAFVLHEWSLRKKNGDYAPGSAHIELDAFLTRRGTAQSALRMLIGELLVHGKPSNAHRT